MIALLYSLEVRQKNTFQKWKVQTLSRQLGIAYSFKKYNIWVTSVAEVKSMPLKSSYTNCFHFNLKIGSQIRFVSNENTFEICSHFKEFCYTHLHKIILIKRPSHSFLTHYFFVYDGPNFIYLLYIYVE